MGSYAFGGARLDAGATEASTFSLTVRRRDRGGDRHVFSTKRMIGGEYRPTDKRGDFLTSIATTCQALAEQLFQHDAGEARQQEHHGLIVVSGSTGAGKSNIATGLIYHYLTNLRELHNKLSRRRPHLITFEDPIEKRWCETPADAQREGIDYTPRQKHIDAQNLTQVVNDALRQTPAVLFVGEIRSDSDWQPLIRFSESGHLAVTTTHAGSLSEAMTRLMRARRCKTPADRGDLARILLGVIHLESHSIGSQCSDFPNRSVVLPTLWRRRPAGIMGLVADGCASLVPQCIAHGNASTLGRQWYARWLENHTHIEKVEAGYRSGIRQRALERDLEEM